MHILSSHAIKIPLYTLAVEVLAFQRIYWYTIKVKNMANHKLQQLAWNKGCKVPKTNKMKIFSSSWASENLKIGLKGEE